MTGDHILVPGVVAVTLLLARMAYRRGSRRAKRSAPAEIVEELRVHKISCLGESPERVALELSLLLGAPEGGAARHPQHSGGATHRGRAGARV